MTMIEKLSTMLSKGLHSVAQLVLVAMMLVITFDVVARWLFDFAITGSYDFIQSGLSMVIFLGLAYTHVHKDHISIDFLVDKLTEKGQQIANIFIELFIAIVMFLTATQLWSNSQRLYQSNTVTGDLGIPIFLFAILAAVGTLAFAIVAVMNVIVNVQKVVKKNES